MINQDLKKKILQLQKNEITEKIIYHRLAAILKDRERAKILEKISEEE